MPCGLSRSKSACDVAILVAVGIPDECAEDGSVGELGAVGVGTVEMALPIRDLGFLAATSLLFSLASNLLAKKLTVLAKVLMVPG